MTQPSHKGSYASLASTDLGGGTQLDAADLESTWAAATLPDADLGGGTQLDAAARPELERDPEDPAKYI